LKILGLSRLDKPVDLMGDGFVATLSPLLASVFHVN
jgi:hypothetical protein